MTSYRKLRLIYPNQESIKKNLYEVFMKFHDKGLNLSVFGEIEAPYHDEISESFLQAISSKVKEFGSDVLIKEYFQTDEGSDMRFFIFQKNGNVIEGPRVDELYGCTFEYSDQEDEEEDEEDEEDIDYDDLDFLEDRREEMLEKCAIEVVSFCKKHKLDVSKKEINEALNTI
jgi:hypothetical protein